MDKFAKAIGAAQGGLTSAAAVVATAAIFLQFIPSTVVIPFWGYVLLIMLAIIFCVLFPAMSAYLAPANAPPQVGDTIPVTIPAKVTPPTKPPTVEPTQTE